MPTIVNKEIEHYWNSNTLGTYTLVYEPQTESFNWQLNATESERILHCPVGKIFPNLGANIPPGAVPLDGRTLRKNDYAEFYDWAKKNVRLAASNEAWEAEKQKYGFCGAFYIDELKATIRIPDFRNALIVGNDDFTTVPNKIISGKLPTISGQFNSTIYSEPGLEYPSGAFYKTSNCYYNANNDTYNGFYRVRMDAHHLNPLYQDTNVIQSTGIGVIWCIQVKQATELNRYIDIDKVLQFLDNNDYIISTWFYEYIEENEQIKEVKKPYEYFRLYKSGWVEQGGIIDASILPGASVYHKELSINLPLAMKDKYYTTLLTIGGPETVHQYERGFRPVLDNCFSLYTNVI